MILEILVINPHDEGDLGSLEPVSSLLQRQLDGQKLPISDDVIISAGDS